MLEDEHMKALVPQEEQGNPLINKFREGVLEDLYKMLEFVLLN